MLKIIKKFWMDESGDCGFKFASGSSKFFALVAVYITTLGDDDSKVVDEAIKELKIQHNLIKNFEFKFSHCKEKLRKEFFQAIVRLPIEYKAIIVEKLKINSPIFRHQPRQLYCETARMLFYDNNPPLESAVLLIDEAVAKIHHKEFNEMVAKLFLLQFYLFGCVIVRLRKMLFAVAGLRPQNILLVFLASLENLKFRYEIVLQPSQLGFEKLFE